MASVMLEKFEKYWGDYSTLLAIVVVPDPRYKMVLVRSTFSKLYVPLEVEARFKEIYDALVEVYKFYDQAPLLLQPNLPMLSLHIDNVEAFVTAQNWLFGYLKDDEVQDCVEVMKDVMHDDVDHDSLPRRCP
ncbi:Zinc finger BED domain-containing protein RICESLEEPER 4 [Bienertia sinuspersici]